MKVLIPSGNVLIQPGFSWPKQLFQPPPFMPSVDDIGVLFDVDFGTVLFVVWRLADGNRWRYLFSNAPGVSPFQSWFCIEFQIPVDSDFALGGTFFNLRCRWRAVSKENLGP